VGRGSNYSRGDDASSRKKKAFFLKKRKENSLKCRWTRKKWLSIKGSTYSPPGRKRGYSGERRGRNPGKGGWDKKRNIQKRDRFLASKQKEKKRGKSIWEKKAFGNK